MRVHQIQGAMNTIYCAAYPDGRRLMLDAGSRVDIKGVMRYLQNAQVVTHERPYPDLCFVSHIHPDHSGGCAMWREQGVPTVGPVGMNRWYECMRGQLQLRIDYALERYVVELTNPHYARHYEEGSTTPHEGAAAQLQGSVAGAVALFKALKELVVPTRDFWLGDGTVPVDTLLDAEGPLCDEFPDWETIHIPGHTNHMLALYNPEYKTLYADMFLCFCCTTVPADAVIKLGSSLRLPAVVSFPALHAATLDRLADLPIERLLLAHGGPVEYDEVYFKETFHRLAETCRTLDEQGKAAKATIVQKLFHTFVFLDTNEIERVRSLVREVVAEVDAEVLESGCGDDARHLARALLQERLLDPDFVKAAWVP